MISTPYRVTTTREPAKAFPPLFDLITGLLEASLPSRVIALEMSRPDGQTWKANLHDIRLREEADLYLSVRSDIPASAYKFKVKTLLSGTTVNNWQSKYDQLRKERDAYAAISEKNHLSGT